MMQRRSILIGLALAFAAAGTGFLAGKMSRSAPNGTSDARTEELFALTLPTPDGTPTPLRQWHGKTLVVNFWATWCPPCRKEMPDFSRLSREYAGQDVQFVGIAIDSADKVREFAQSSPVSYPLLIADDAALEVAKKLGNTMLALPYTVVVNPDGHVDYAHLGAVDAATLAPRLHR